MKYVVVFTYMDGEEFEVQVAQKDMERFMNTLGSSEVYFNNEKGVGVWVPIDKIRYFQVERVDDQGKRVVVSNTTVQKEEGEDKPRETAVGSPGNEGVESALQVNLPFP